MKFASKPALIRVAVVLSVLATLTLVSWFLMIRMPLRSHSGPLPRMTAEQTSLRDQLKRDIEMLGGKIGDRNVIAFPQLGAAADYVEAALVRSGFKVNRLGFEVHGKTCHNLEVETLGQERPEEIVVVGAHYDSVWGCPGANDNGSGTAALLALAGLFGNRPAARTLRLVAFVNEEPPYFQTDEMGSLVYARQCRARGDKVVAMLSLETIGYFTEVAGSQKYPFPIGVFYPSRGNFIAFVGNISSAGLVRQCVTLFRRNAAFPSEGAALPALLPGIGWSDHWSFWQEGYMAAMVTDTAPFRYPHYHTEKDTPDQLGYDSMARVVAGLREVIVGLVNP